jgi:DNA invertase Pin-like site-specific DNA recombinase
MKEVLHIYCRVSSGIQETDGTSLDSQQQLGEIKAEQLNLTPQIWLEGAASSDNDEIDKRPQLSALMTAIDDGLVRHLYVTEQSRLARTDHVASMIRYRCNMMQVALYIRDTVYDFANPMDILTVQIMGAFSQFENAIRKERSRLGKLQKVRQGYWHGGVPPYGFKLKASKGGNKLSINPDEAKWVKRIFEWYSKTSSTKYIQQQLRQEYVGARRGGSFSLGSIQALIKNTHYTGKYVFTDGVSGEEIEVTCPRIMDDRLWDDCQTRRDHIIKRKGQTNRAKRFSLLKTYMWCGHCGTGIGAKVQPAQNRHYYYCPKKERQWVKSDEPVRGGVKDVKWERGRHCEMTRSLNIPATNAMVWKVVAETAANSHFLKERIKTEMMSSKGETESELKSKVRNLQKVQKRYLDERRDLEAALTKIETDKIMKRISAKQTVDIRKNIQSELDACILQLDDVASKLNESTQQQKWVDWIGQFEKTYANVDNFTEEQQRQYLDGLVERIDVRLDTDTNEHLLDIKFQFPIVADEYVKNDTGYKVQGGRYNAIERGQFNFKSVGKKVSDNSIISKKKHRVVTG